mmetsp:Transcript_15581/g.26805  ORF Transcript_15581/g.26805 Transcript_15581/m.26805 type:complete len:127 (+) Transcript_15581:35-415(+)|eukprot:CAMPEP_0168591360 /NCGR_PEP_ID=MMETSP0420-20121227/7092_1 /TAXON_ID=498008 /ORGANISM="Pessonella sp." /LENGTH=126 /DNA_ID=CAMNT_0008627145 /DNA_START=35 /DNA_END=415 /DNA_ORIENTATION=+
MSAKCPTCTKTVYAMEAQKGLGKMYHKLCFKCSQCAAKIEPGSETERQGQLVCKVCGNATEGFRGAGHANVASFKATGDVRPSGGVGFAKSNSGGGASGASGAKFCSGCGTKSTGGAFCSSCGNKL